MTTFAKVSSVVVIGSGVAGGGTIYWLNSNSSTPKTSSVLVPTIRSKITTETGRKILDTNKSGWDIKLHAYKALENKVNATINDEGGLKTWCTNTLDSNFSDSQNNSYLQAKQVCTLPTSKEKLLKEQKALATEDNDWQSRATAYTIEGKDSLIIPELNGKNNPTKEEIKDWCNKALEKEIEDEKNNYDLTVKWCTKTGA